MKVTTKRWRPILLFAALVAPTTARGQSAPDARSGFSLGAGVTTVNSPMHLSCGGGDGGLEANAGLVLRPRGIWIVEADVRSAAIVSADCASLRVLRPVDTTYSAPLHDPYLTSTLRVGVETPVRLPLIRLSAGAGVYLAGRRSPFATFDAIWSTRGKRARLFVAAEQTIRRASALERTFDLPTAKVVRTRDLPVNALTNSYRVGLEFPFGQRGDR
jgi:hypothetical protein